MGQKLAATLNRLIDGQASEENGRDVIVAEMAETVGVDVQTIDEILQGSNDSPPLEYLRGFASVLYDASVNVLKEAIEEDERKTRQVTIKEVIPREQYERLQQIKEELERALDS